ncbi:RICIN domain-containing protein [Streptomyces sp. NPDC002845]
MIAPADNGAYTIESRSNGYKLDVAGASTTDGSAIDQWSPPAAPTSSGSW